MKAGIWQEAKDLVHAFITKRLAPARVMKLRNLYKLTHRHYLLSTSQLSCILGFEHVGIKLCPLQWSVSELSRAQT